MGDQEEKGEQVLIELRWDLSGNIPTIYANQLLITHAGGEFYLLFGEMTPPMISNPDKESLPEFVTVKPVAKMAITPANMVNIAAVIGQNVERFMAQFKVDGGGGNDADDQ